MRACPRCKSPFHTRVEFCGIDGERVVDYDTDPLIGATIDRYRLVERLGSGGMATVYRAVHTVIDRECALKVLYGELASDKIFVERFKREAQTASRIKHENVVGVLDFGTTPEGATFLLMEYLRGRTLSAVLAEGPLSPSRAALLVRDIALGLEAAHVLGFIHRDLKPANIMVVDDGAPAREKARILDFGLVADVNDDTSARLTLTGQTLGTPSYMAPEQVQRTQVTAQTDLYALGVILYEMLAGHRPFRGAAIEVLGQHATAPPPPLAPAQGLEKLALKLLEKAPKKRPKSAADVVRAIEKLGVLPKELPPAELPTTPALPRSSADSGALAARASGVLDAALLVQTRNERESAEHLRGGPVTSSASAPAAPATDTLDVATEDIDARAVRGALAATDDDLVASGLASRNRALRLVAAGAVVAGAVALAAFFHARLRADDAAAVAAGADAGADVAAPLLADGGVADGDGGVDGVDGVDVDGGAKEDGARDPAFEATLDKVDDDVLNALKRRGLVRAEAESIATLKQPFTKYDVARVGDDAGKLAQAAGALAADIARANIPRPIVEQRIERVTVKLKRRIPKLSKRQVVSLDRQLQEWRARAHRDRTGQGELNRIFAGAVAMERRLDAL